MEGTVTEWTKDEIMFEAGVKFVVQALLNMREERLLTSKTIESQNVLIEAIMKIGSDAANVQKF